MRKAIYIKPTCTVVRFDTHCTVLTSSTQKHYQSIYWQDAEPAHINDFGSQTIEGNPDHIDAKKHDMWSGESIWDN